MKKPGLGRQSKRDKRFAGIYSSREELSTSSASLFELRDRTGRPGPSGRIKQMGSEEEGELACGPRVRRCAARGQVSPSVRAPRKLTSVRCSWVCARTRASLLSLAELAPRFPESVIAHEETADGARPFILVTHCDFAGGILQVSCADPRLME